MLLKLSSLIFTKFLKSLQCLFKWENTNDLMEIIVHYFLSEVQQKRHKQFYIAGLKDDCDIQLSEIFRKKRGQNNVMYYERKVHNYLLSP